MHPTPTRLLLWRLAVTTLAAVMAAAIVVASFMARNVAGSVPDAAPGSDRIADPVG